MNRFNGDESTLYGGDTSPVNKTRKQIKKETLSDDNDILSNTSLQRVMRKNRELQRKIERLEREIEKLKK
tara:strand:- start:919 stop:1128 length:210 start_codon:yes stop_codon:yes gene_type:complete